MENSKKRHREHSSGDGLVGSSSVDKATQTRHFSTTPWIQVKGKLRTFDYNKHQNSKLYTTANTLQYLYRNKRSI
jgi:hypothetical protein